MARVGIDLDGVCYDFAASLRQSLCNLAPFGSARLCPTHSKMYSDPQRWEFYKDWGFSDSEFKHHVRKGVDAGIVFLYGAAHEGTKEAWEALKAAGHDIIVGTDRDSLGGPNARKNTYDWLEREGLAPDEVHFQANKTLVPDCDYFVDDKLENYDALDAAGVKVYLWDRPWNQDDSKERRRVSSWDEFLEAISWSEGSWVNRKVDRVTEYFEKTQIDLKVPELDGEVRITSPTGGQKGRKLARFGLIPKGALRKVAEVYGKGAEKYEDWNWRKGYDWDLSLDALHRHLADWEEGKSYHEDGHSLASVVFHALTLMTFEEEHPEFDTRFKKSEGAA